MLKINRFLNTFLFLLIPLLCNSQVFRNDSLAKAETEMGIRNMYHTISWGMSPLIPYLFDQNKGTVTYTIDETYLEVIAVPRVLGTFNLKDDTFLWADHNKSIDKRLIGSVTAFRQSLPVDFQKSKFRGTPETGLALLALFGVYLDANATDFKRQDDTIIYFALMGIEVRGPGEEQRTIVPKNHVFLEQDEATLNLVKDFLGKKCEINKLHFEENLDLEQADQRMVELHLQYWANEDPYFFPALSSPCADDPATVLDWKVFSIERGRKFVMFVNNLGYSKEFRAYEINPKANGKKMIINEY